MISIWWYRRYSNGSHEIRSGTSSSISGGGESAGFWSRKSEVGSPKFYFFKNFFQLPSSVFGLIAHRSSLKLTANCQLPTLSLNNFTHSHNREVLFKKQHHIHFYLIIGHSVLGQTETYSISKASFSSDNTTNSGLCTIKMDWFSAQTEAGMDGKLFRTGR